jgi:hypothetical protein
MSEGKRIRTESRLICDLVRVGIETASGLYRGSGNIYVLFIVMRELISIQGRISTLPIYLLH